MHSALIDLEAGSLMPAATEAQGTEHLISPEILIQDNTSVECFQETRVHKAVQNNDTNIVKLPLVQKGATATQPGDISESREKVPIKSQYEHCRNSFNRLLQDLEASNDQATTRTLLEDEFGRFNIWAGNAGAHRIGKVSLDYRLREAPHIHAELTELLGELSNDLEEGAFQTSFLQGAFFLLNLHNVEFQALKLIKDGDGDHSPGSQISLTEEFRAELGSHVDDFIAELGTVEDQEAEIKEFDYLVSDITHIITCLYKFSIAIRNPAPKKRLHKIAAIDVSFYEDWDINHINGKFRQENSQSNFKVEEYLIERLGKANTRRRQLFMYYKNHHETISRYIDDPLPSKSATTTNEPTNISELPTQDPDHERAATLNETIKSQTTMSTIVPGLVRTELDEDQLTQTSYATSASQTMRIRVPSPPNEVAAFEGKPFECPYCFNIIKVRSRQDWKYVGTCAPNFYGILIIF